MKTATAICPGCGQERAYAMPTGTRDVTCRECRQHFRITTEGGASVVEPTILETPEAILSREDWERFFRGELLDRLIHTDETGDHVYLYGLIAIRFFTDRWLTWSDVDDLRAAIAPLFDDYSDPGLAGRVKTIVERLEALLPPRDLLPEEDVN